MATKFFIWQNDYLDRTTIGYYHQFYTGYNEPNNPNFLNTLKNTYDNTNINVLRTSRNEVINILVNDLPNIISENNMQNCMCVCVPRAKAIIEFSDEQLMFREAVIMAVRQINGVVDGTDCIIRSINTRTTHFRKEIPNYINDGELPYVGITNDTCQIDEAKIKNQNIILIDDIYTDNVNIDEDCIQALYNNGAKKIIFYAIGLTRRN